MSFYTFYKYQYIYWTAGCAYICHFCCSSYIFCCVTSRRPTRASLKYHGTLLSSLTSSFSVHPSFFLSHFSSTSKSLKKTKNSLQKELKTKTGGAVWGGLFAYHIQRLAFTVLLCAGADVLLCHVTSTSLQSAPTTTRYAGFISRWLALGSSIFSLLLLFSSLLSTTLQSTRRPLNRWDMCFWFKNLQ